jgi:hypothetical protein
VWQWPRQGLSRDTVSSLARLALATASHAQPAPNRPHHRTRSSSERPAAIASTISVGRDRETGGAVVRVIDANGHMIALRLWKRQARTLAKGLAGFVASIDE